MAIGARDTLDHHGKLRLLGSIRFGFPRCVPLLLRSHVYLIRCPVSPGTLPMQLTEKPGFVTL